MIKQLETLVPDNLKATLLLRSFGLAKVPLLFATSPQVVEINDQTCAVKMPFRKIIKNHLGSVYFGALAIGADCCVGLLAIHQINKSGKKVNLVFKSFEAEFIKRAEGPITFICGEGDEVKKMLDETLSSGERVNKKLKAHALVNDEIVANFILELSLKHKK
ncbi:MAG: DUF4442 domain-containing protein [Bdellovibrionales bacterium]|nr:DUF4442 domain-containing protein [Bdellovibrionales bacterium]NQZ19018.1 DUF4442 domain-containing protein [Bdellovibrionales bacterium]